MTEELRTPFDRLATDLRQIADEVRVKLHLAGMEAKDLWSKLEPSLEKFETEAAKVSVEIGHELNQVGVDLKRQLVKLRDMIRQ